MVLLTNHPLDTIIPPPLVLLLLLIIPLRYHITIDGRETLIHMLSHEGGLGVRGGGVVAVGG